MTLFTVSDGAYQRKFNIEFKFGNAAKDQIGHDIWKLFAEPEDGALVIYLDHARQATFNSITDKLHCMVKEYGGYWKGQDDKIVQIVLCVGR